MKDDSGEALTTKESDVFKLDGYNLNYVIPATEEYAGVYSLVIKTTTSIDTETYFKVETTLIEPCHTEEVLFLQGEALERTFIIRNQEYEDEHLDVDLTEYLESNRKDNGC